MFLGGLVFVGLVCCLLVVVLIAFEWCSLFVCCLLCVGVVCCCSWLFGVRCSCWLFLVVGVSVYVVWRCCHALVGVRCLLLFVCVVGFVARCCFLVVWVGLFAVC